MEGSIALSRAKDRDKWKRLRPSTVANLFTRKCSGAFATGNPVERVSASVSADNEDFEREMRGITAVAASKVVSRRRTTGGKEVESYSITLR